MMTPKEIAERVKSGDFTTFSELKDLACDYLGIRSAYLKTQEPLGDEKLAEAQEVGETNSGYRSGRIIRELLDEIRLLRAAAEVDRAEIERLKAVVGICGVALEANRHNYVCMNADFSFCGACGERAPHCSAESGFEGAGDPMSIPHRDDCPYRLSCAAIDAARADAQGGK